MSEQQPKPVSDNLGDIVSAGPIVPNSMEEAAGEPAFGPVKDSMNVESPKLAPDQGSATAPKVELPKAEAPKVELPKTDAPKIDAKTDAAKPSGRIMVLKPDQSWNGSSGPESQAAANESGLFGKRRVAALAAVIALAAIAGAIGGALATSGVRATSDTSKLASTRALEDAISRVDTEIAALRTSLEQSSKYSATQLSKAGDRLDKVEKAQAEPAAKLAKLSETVEKLRVTAATPAAAPAVAAAPVAPKETTASIQTANAASAPVPVPAPKPEVARLPTVEGWVLRDVSNGSAVIEGRQGMYEVYAGDPVPGLGRVDAIRKQDGRWVVVTTKGLIVAR